MNRSGVNTDDWHRGYHGGMKMKTPAGEGLDSGWPPALLGNHGNLYVTLSRWNSMCYGSGQFLIWRIYTLLKIVIRREIINYPQDGCLNNRLRIQGKSLADGYDLLSNNTTVSVFCMLATCLSGGCLDVEHELSLKRADPTSFDLQFSLWLDQNILND